ncbi:MAG: CAP domain-containing protein [Thermoanaerobaculia bacterium]
MTTPPRRRFDRLVPLAALLAAVAVAPAAPAQDGPEGDLAGPLAIDEAAFIEYLAEAPLATATAPPASFEDQLVDLVNQDRQNCANTSFFCVANAGSCGFTVCGSPLPPLKKAQLLSVASDGHSSNMGTRNFHMHCDPDTGTLPGNRALAVGWPTSNVGENIAAGYSSPAAVMSTSNGWMSDCGHCANILNTSSREIGLGYSFDGSDTNTVRQSSTGLCPVQTSNNGPYGHYWTQDFSGRTSFGVFPLVIEREKYLVNTTSVAMFLYQPGGSSPQMRFSNDGVSWSSPVAFNANPTTTLTAGDGVKTVYSEVTTSSGTFRACDRIWLDNTGTVSDVIFADSFECGGVDLWDLPIVTSS